MMSLSCKTIGILLVVASLVMPRVMANEQNIRTDEGRLLGVGEEIRKQHGECRLSLNDEGNLIVRTRLLALNNEENTWLTSWSTGGQGKADSNYALELTQGGNLEIRNEEEEVVWTTNLPEDTTARHKVVIDGACRLKLKRNKEDVWENIKTSEFKAGQVLQRGDMFRMSVNYKSASGADIAHPFKLQYVLLLQHDCNLVQFVGTDNADKAAGVWKSDTSSSNGKDCYLYLDKGHAALYEGRFDNTKGFGADRGKMLWKTGEKWMEMSGDDVQEGYDIVLQSNGDVFSWQFCADECEPLPDSQNS